MSQCKNVFTRCRDRGGKCNKSAKENGLCLLCSKKPNKGMSNSSITDQQSQSMKLEQNVVDYDESTGLGIAETSKLQLSETLGQMCQKVSAKDLLNETEKYCRDVRNVDISLDMTATGKFIAQIKQMGSSTGYECRISVIDKYSVGCQCGKLSISLAKAGPWNEIASFMIQKSEEVTDGEALIAILWNLTNGGWPDEYYEWLEVDRYNLTTEEFHKAVKQKLGL